MRKKILIAIISAFVLLMIPTISTLAASSNEYIENDNYPEDIKLKNINYSWCFILISGMGSVSSNKFFNFRKDITFIYQLGSTHIYEIFKVKYHYFGGEYVSGELKYFSGFIFSDETSFNIIGFSRIVRIF